MVGRYKESSHIQITIVIRGLRTNICIRIVWNIMRQTTKIGKEVETNLGMKEDL